MIWVPATTLAFCLAAIALLMGAFAYALGYRSGLAGTTSGPGGAWGGEPPRPKPEPHRPLPPRVNHRRSQSAPRLVMDAQVSACRDERPLTPRELAALRKQNRF